MNYPTYTAVNIDTNKLLSIGFNQAEINNLTYIYNNGGKFTTAFLQQMGYSYEQAKRLVYAYNICAGKVSVNSKEELIKHLRKMFGPTYKISINDLATSKVTNVPRVAVVANIPDAPYNVWNSNNYKGMKSLYKVIDVTGQKVTIETGIKPKLQYGQPKVIPGMLEIKGINTKGNAIVVFDKNYCKLCNRFIVVASLRNPEFHFGKYEMLCFEGTRVYVYVSNMGIRENVKYNMGNQRIYGYGIFPAEIKPKLDTIAKQLYQHLHGVTVTYEPANQEYHVINKEKKLVEDGEEIEF